MPKCFIIMPITTPKEMFPKYSNDADHFKHVLEHLFIPAIEKAKMEPISPICKGADLIHAEIIQNLESADLVLCDISTLNPNVFFELGIRTALNKEVCIVKDSFTENIPFDTTILNNLTYDPSLAPWVLSNEIQNIYEHIIASRNRSKGTNTLWKYFGLTSKGEQYQENPSDVKDMLTLIVELLQQNKLKATKEPEADDPVENIVNFANNLFKRIKAKVDNYSVDGNTIVLDCGDYSLDEKDFERISHLAHKNGFNLEVLYFGTERYLSKQD